MGLEPADLARWTRFAAKGGIGKCVAQCDCVAESSDDLMFLKVCIRTFLLLFASSLGTRMTKLRFCFKYPTWTISFLYVSFSLDMAPIRLLMLYRVTARASSVGSLVSMSSFSVASRSR